VNVALICPPHLLKRYGTKTKYHLVLPHLFRSQKYLDFYQTKSDDEFIILDNGAAEGLEYGAKHLLTLADQIGAAEVVVPDTLKDGNDTLAKAQYFARYAKSEHQYMFVLQGNTVEEVMFCLKALEHGNMFSYITTIGIPRHFHDIGKNFRVQLTEYMIEEHYNDKFYIHFLGASSWMREAVLLAETVQGLPNFRGIDTSMPIYMGLEGFKIADQFPWRSRPSNYFTRSDDNKKLIEENIETYLDWALYANETPPRG